ncbi:hypothetical protein [Sphingomonas sp. PAMC 26605]|uniref:hypothetical protein n=1 Tax=Sphingomonas sp. PAMC 26605 TaxID=1112214 RepID=UPI0012F4E996|nr:hypothetical protein [Sphingomonas sp. PAMC 26605]
MIRHLIPHIAIGGWIGAALTRDDCSREDEVEGRTLVIQWLGLMIEIGIGAIR